MRLAREVIAENLLVWLDPGENEEGAAERLLAALDAAGFAVVGKEASNPTFGRCSTCGDPLSTCCPTCQRLWES